VLPGFPVRLRAMAVLSRAEAQQRADAVRSFRRELTALEREGVLVLNDEQRTALAAHHDGLLAEYAHVYDIDRDAQSKQLSLGMRVASFLGALALAASVFFLFYQFWGRFPTSAQVALLLGASLASFCGTLWIRRIDASGYFAKLAAMVAFACFVLNIAMLGDIFNITPSDKAFVPWAAFALLLGYACDLRLLLAAGILCIIAFISSRAGTVSGMYWIHFGERPENFFPAALTMFLIPQLIPHRRFPEFAPVYRIFALLSLFLPMLVLANWGQLSYLDFEAQIVEGLYQMLGFAACAGAIWLGMRMGWPHVVNTGVVFFVIFLYTKFYDWWWEIMPKYLFFLVLALVAMLVLLVLRRLRGSTKAPEVAA
jgi:uncharacterized membrane protein